MTAQEIELRVARSEEELVGAHAALCNAALRLEKRVQKAAGINPALLAAARLLMLFGVVLFGVAVPSDSLGGGFLDLSCLSEEPTWRAICATKPNCALPA